MTKIVNIVHCIDTEGPLYESLEATFKRVNNTYDLKLTPSLETLKKIQNKEIDLGGKEEAVANMIKPEYLNYNDTWDKIDKMLDKITSESFRKSSPDSFGNGWVYNWFCLDHVGFTGNNPRRRDFGFHNIFDHYRNYNNRNNITQDLIQWHFHPIPIIPDSHRSGTSYLSSSMVFEILARKIIDRKWFPSAYRPGFHTERPDSNWFLEQWIPFDYANQSKKQGKVEQPDLSEGKFGDWRKAPLEWMPYHPSHDDYQAKGSCRRWIARVLNIGTRLRELDIEELRDGFKRADEGKPTLVSFTCHDFRDMQARIEIFRNMIKIVSKEFPDVKFRYCNAIEAMQNVIEIKEIKNPIFSTELIKKQNYSTLKIKSKNKIFGPQPFFAIKTKTAQYIWQNLDFQSEKEWSYTFDFNTIDINAVSKIGIAANTDSGGNEVFVIEPNDV